MNPSEKKSAGAGSKLSTGFRENGLYAAPVLSGALGIAVPVLASTTLRSGMILSLIFSVMLVSVCVLSSLCFSYLPEYLRVVVVLLSASLVFVGACEAAMYWFGHGAVLYHVYAPLLIVSPLLFSRAGLAARQHVGIAAADSASCAVGFTLVSCAVGAVRELLGKGTLYGETVLPSMIRNRIESEPFFGLIVLGFLAAAVSGVRLHFAKKKQKKTGA